jgi:glycosyltransferase involved in cell wall biosynthesis
MNILHVTPSIYPATYWGGPMFTVYALNRALARMEGVSLTTLSTDSAGPLRQQQLDTESLPDLYPGQDVLVMPRVAGDSVSWALLRHLLAMIRRADVVHLTAIYSFPTIPTLLLCRLMGTPLVWSLHGAVQDEVEWQGTPRRGLKRLWERICNGLLVPERSVLHLVSGRERDATISRIGRGRPVVIPNGVDAPAKLPARRWLPEGRLRLMFLGRLSPKKGVENLLQAMATLDDSSVELSIYGSGDAAYTASLKTLAGRLGLLDRTVFFRGQVDGEAKERAFAEADACIVPSHTECFCMVVAEALAHGVPVIASHGTPWEGVVEHGCGLWVENRPEALADAVIAIRSMDLPDMGARGRSWMQHDLAWETLAAEMLDVYRRLAAH